MHVPRVFVVADGSGLPEHVCNRRIVLERSPMAEIIHPFYESHRGAMEAAMRHRLDLAEAMLSERAHPIQY